MRVGRAALAALTLVCASCARRPDPPTAWQWGIPVYPHATVIGSTRAAASFVLYRTGDAVADVDAWYAAELPKGTQHAYDAAGQQSTFAVFDAGARRTVHVQREGSATAILVTKLQAK